METYINQYGADNIACFIAEPIMGAGGVIVPPKGYIKRTYELCQKYNIFYISDEVVTAFVRLGLADNFVDLIRDHRCTQGNIAR